jgi:hypothetical protein
MSPWWKKGLALFPDAVTTRGQKHLRELMEMVRNGDRGVLLFTVQRGDGNAVAPADRIDPEYGRLLREAVANGVEASGLPGRGQAGADPADRTAGSSTGLGACRTYDRSTANLPGRFIFRHFFGQ